jgi:hypothetical protein
VKNKTLETEVQKACRILAQSIEKDEDWKTVSKVLDNLFHGLAYGYSADGVMKELFKARNKYTGVKIDYINWPDLAKGINFYELRNLWKIKQKKPALKLVKTNSRNYLNPGKK